MRGVVAGFVAVVSLVAVLGGTAWAGETQSTGLYAPFPSLLDRGHLKTYVGDFGVKVTSGEADQGVAVGKRLRYEPSAAPATQRADPGGGRSRELALGLLAALCAVGLCLALARIGRGQPIAAAVICLLVLAGCGDPKEEPTAQKETGPFLGMTSEDSFAAPGSYRRRMFREQARAGVGLLRQSFAWSRIERRPGEYDLAYYDDYVADAARAGLMILPILFDPPEFSEQAAHPDATPTTTAPPRELQSMARWAQVLVRRYGPKGSLWRERSEIPRRPITAWQIWNEPNLPAYWNARPSAAQYVQMLTRVGRAIRSADPKAEIVTAGLPESRLGIPFATYLRQMYRAGAAGRFDVLAVNAYSDRASGISIALAGARRITAAAEDGDVPILLTEFGWATPPSPRGSFTVSEKTQAALVAETITALARERDRLRLRGVVYYQWRDAPVYPGGVDYWGLHTGLLDRKGEPKAALRSFSTAADLARRLLPAQG